MRSCILGASTRRATAHLGNPWGQSHVESITEIATISLAKTTVTYYTPTMDNPMQRSRRSIPSNTSECVRQQGAPREATEPYRGQSSGLSPGEGSSYAATVARSATRYAECRATQEALRHPSSTPSGIARLTRAVSRRGRRRRTKVRRVSRNADNAPSSEQFLDGGDDGL